MRAPQETFDAAIQTLEQVSKVVESLYEKVRDCSRCSYVEGQLITMTQATKIA